MMDARLAAELERAYIKTAAGMAMLVTDDLRTAAADYATAMREHRDASEAALALSHVEGIDIERAGVRERLVTADDRRDALARELADEVLVALGLR
jgi:hypothetical protein